jgi:hypothetical protein
MTSLLKDNDQGVATPSSTTAASKAVVPSRQGGYERQTYDDTH